MIYSLRGKLVHTEPSLAVIECGGVGYGCKTTNSTLSTLPKKGGEVMLYTYLHITDNALDLFGFSSSMELQYFKLIISVSGVGPKVALAILSDLTPEKFSLCIAAADYKTITRTPGVGNKIAQRLVLELKDKISNDALNMGIASGGETEELGSGALSEAIAALSALGYSRSEAASALSKLGGALTVEEYIKGGLKALSAHK